MASDDLQEKYLGVKPQESKPGQSFKDRLAEVIAICQALAGVRSDSDRQALQRELVKKERLLS